VLRELDESFANVYSTVVSVQNMAPLADRRILAVVIGALATIGALVFDIGSYQNFLYLIGSVFVPMFAVFAVRYFVQRRWTTWDTSERAPEQWLLLVPWLLGFAAYQIVNPGYIGWWVTMWGHVRDGLHIPVEPWMSASIVSFVVAALFTLPLRGSRAVAAEAVS
jgi:NCS1 family nucleobase:cation symporter-1